jgi:hypothetical protein
MQTKHPTSDSTESWATLATFDTPAQLQPLLAILEGAGVKTHVLDERRAQRFWFLVRPQAGVHLQVPETSLLVARDLLHADPSAQAAFLKAVRCPACGSSCVQFPQMTRKNYLPTLAAHVLVAFRVMEHECYCEDCHHSWVRKVPADKVARAATSEA